MPRRLPPLEISPPFARRISYETRPLVPGFRVDGGEPLRFAPFDGCRARARLRPSGDGLTKSITVCSGLVLYDGRDSTENFTGNFVAHRQSAPLGLRRPPNSGPDQKMPRAARPAACDSMNSTRPGVDISFARNLVAARFESLLADDIAKARQGRNNSCSRPIRGPCW